MTFLTFIAEIEMDRDKILEAYYFDSKHPAAYARPEKLLKVLRKKYPGVFTLGYISNWLSNQDAYALQKPVRHRFRTTNVTSINEQWDIDLLSVINLAENNDGVKYLLFAIDIFSRKLHVQPLKNKTAKSVLDAMKIILQDVKPKKIRAEKRDLELKLNQGTCFNLAIWCASVLQRHRFVELIRNNIQRKYFVYPAVC